MIGYECRRVARWPMVWAILALLLGAGTWGARNAARLHRDQAADIARMTEAEAAWYEDIRARAARYGQPSTEEVPYWQDPTGASGFSRYFLRRFAAKPHLPLSTLAVGQSDLQPFAVPLRLETLFGGDRVYDFEPPRALATGIFDLSFVLLFVAPLCLGIAVAVVGAQERDQGILPLVASQPVRAAHWWSVRLGALAVVLVPGVVVCVLAALAAAGAPIVAAWPETVAATMLVAAQTLFWIAVAGWCVARGHGAVATASTVVGIWLVLTIALPLAGSLALRAVASPPSPVTDVDELRRITDDVQGEADEIVRRGLIAHFGPDAAVIDPGRLDYATRLVLITQEMERRLQHQEVRRQEYRRAASLVARAIWWLSPPVAFQTALTDLAGTGTARHHVFLDQVRAFQLELRDFMYPRVLAQLRSGPSRSCEGCPGRLTFLDYEAIPSFAMGDLPTARRVAAAVSTASWLALVVAAIAVAGVGRGAAWALES